MSDGDAMLFGVPSLIDQQDLSFHLGLPIEGQVPLIEIVRDEDSQGRLLDNVAAPGVRGLLVSSRLRTVLGDAGVDNVQYCQCRIVNPADGAVSGDYSIGNVVGRIGCVDWTESDVEAFPNRPEAIQFVDSLVLDESKIGGALMFRLREFLPLVVVHERVKAACEAAGITGLRFCLPGDFST
jgi:hypothetical protein